MKNGRREEEARSGATPFFSARLPFFPYKVSYLRIGPSLPIPVSILLATKKKKRKKRGTSLNEPYRANPRSPFLPFFPFFFLCFIFRNRGGSFFFSFYFFLFHWAYLPGGRESTRNAVSTASVCGNSSFFPFFFHVEEQNATNDNKLVKRKKKKLMDTSLPCFFLSSSFPPPSSLRS